MIRQSFDEDMEDATLKLFEGQGESLVTGFAPSDKGLCDEARAQQRGENVNLEDQPVSPVTLIPVEDCRPEAQIVPIEPDFVRIARGGDIMRQQSVVDPVEWVVRGHCLEAW
jgi:hypothetical protein